MRGLCILLMMAASWDMLAQKKLLCLQEKVSVYCSVYSKGLEGDNEKWQIDLEIANNTNQDLYYRARLQPLEIEKKGSSPVNTHSIVKFVNPLIPPYLKISVLNEIRDSNIPQHYVHGKSTFIPTTDSTTIQKIDQSRHLQSFEVWIKKDSYPIVEGQFLETLRSLEEVRKRTVIAKEDR